MTVAPEVGWYTVKRGELPERVRLVEVPAAKLEAQRDRYYDELALVADATFWRQLVAAEIGKEGADA